MLILDALDGKDYFASPPHETPEERSPAMPAMLPNDTPHPTDSPMRDTADEVQTAIDPGEMATGTTSGHGESGREGKLRLLDPLRRREMNTKPNDNTPAHPAQQESNPQTAVTQGNDTEGENNPPPEETPTTGATTQDLPQNFTAISAFTPHDQEEDSTGKKKMRDLWLRRRPMAMQTLPENHTR